MENFYLNLNAQTNGEHEIHRESCYYYNMYKLGHNFKLLGPFNNALEAVKYAKSKYPNLIIDGCAYCCPEAHRM